MRKGEWEKGIVGEAEQARNDDYVLLIAVIDKGWFTLLRRVRNDGSARSEGEEEGEKGRRGEKEKRRIGEI